MTTPAIVANTVSTIIPFLKPLANVAMGLTRTDPETQAKVQGAMDGVQQSVAALAQSETAAESQPLVQRILADAEAVIQVAAGLPLPPPFNIILMVAASLLPTLIGAANTLTATRTTVPAVAHVPAAAA